MMLLLANSQSNWRVTISFSNSKPNAVDNVGGKVILGVSKFRVESKYIPPNLTVFIDWRQRGS
jgi:hypothetical protein